MANYSNKDKFDFEKMLPSLITPEGSVKMVSKNHWPILENSMIEPHWHPDTAEMGYIMEGRARITIVSPNVNHQGDTFQLKQDDIYFVPRSYPHHIENIGECSLKIIIFFDKSNCSQIGYKTGFLAFSTQVLGGALQCGVGQVPTIPGNSYHTIVPRINPIDLL